MFQNRVPDRIKQIIWNDTANDPYSKESVARRLLVYFDISSLDKYILKILSK